MKVLDVNEKFMRLCGLFSSDQSTMVDKIRRLATICVFLTLFLSALLGSAFYVYFHPDNISDCIMAFLEFSGSTAAFVMYTEILADPSTVERIFDELQSIANDAQGTNAVGVYRKTELQCRFLSKWITVAILTFNILFNFGTFTLAFPIFEMWRGNFDASTWFYPFKMYIPFDTTTILGWYIHAVLTSTLSFSFAATYAVVLFYLWSCCMHIKTCCQHIQIIFDDNDEVIGAEDKSELQQKKDLLENIKIIHSLHIKIMEIQQFTASLCSKSSFTLLMSNVLVFSGLSYNIEEELRAHAYASCLFYGLCLLFCLTWTFSLCYATTTATVAIENIAVTVYNSKWNEYPPEMRKYLILMMARSQRPVYFTGMGLISCTLEVFMKLNAKAVSYYMMYRRLSGL